MAMSAFLPCGAQTKGTQSNEFVINDMRFRIIAPAKVELKAFEGKGEIVIHNGPRVKHIVDGKEVEILEDRPYQLPKPIDVTVPATVNNGGKTYTVVAIGNMAFGQNGFVKTVKLPNTVTEIGDSAFLGSQMLENITLSSKLRTIGARAFCGTNISQMTIPAGVTKIGKCAFVGVKKLSELSVAPGNKAFKTVDGVLFTANGKRLIFYPSTKAGDYVVPAGVKHIEDEAFLDANSLFNIEMPAGLLTIGEDAFSGCSQMSNVVVPKSVKKIGPQAFTMMYGLRKIEVEQGNTAYTVVDGLLYNFAKDTLIQCPMDMRVGKIDVPQGVRIIDDWAFYSQKHLKEVSLPASLKELGASGFSYCSELQTVNISPESTLRVVPVHAFIYCKKLQHLSLPATVRKIGDKAFYECRSLTKLQLTDDVDYIGKMAFGFCHELEIDKIPASLTDIESGAFFSCRKIVNLVIPNTVKAIGSQAFYGCDGMETVDLGTGVTSIGSEAFSSCEKLREVAIPDQVTTLGHGTFKGNKAMTKLTFGSGLTALPSSMCWYCPSLTDVEIPANIREIGMDAFYQCPLKTVKFLSATPLDNDRRISEFENVTILVPKGSLADYKAAPWTVEIKTIKEYKK